MRLPAESSRRAAQRRRVAFLAERASFAIGEQLLRGESGLQFPQQCLADLQHRQAVFRADVVDHFRFASMEDDLDGPNDIVHVGVIANLLSVAMDLQRFAVQEIVDEGGNDLFDVLTRTIDIAQANDAERQFETLAVGFNEKLRRGDRRRVRIDRIEEIRLLIAARRRFPVDFIGADVEELPDFPVDSTGLEHGVCPEDVRLREGDAVAEGVVQVRLN